MLDIVGSVGSVIDLAKKAKQAVDALQQSETKLHIADLISKLADLKIEASELALENNELKRKIAQFEQQRSLQLELRGDVYMAGNEGPFCTTCWDTKNQRVRIKEEMKDFQQILGFKYKCPVCKTHHKGE